MTTGTNCSNHTTDIYIQFSNLIKQRKLCVNFLIDKVELKLKAVPITSAG